jgi:hypothetical protein
VSRDAARLEQLRAARLAHERTAPDLDRLAAAVDDLTRFLQASGL